jgi:hypothetical protein
MFSYQIFMTAQGTPDVDFILDDAKGRGDVHYRTRTADHDEAVPSGLALDQRAIISIAPRAGSSDT